MNKNIILAGVGGQGILTIAAIIDYAAMQKGLFIKQAEVHGMSQRGGSVQSHLRISDKEIYSDLIAKGTADLILSLEPMETLRYLPYLSANGKIVYANVIINNIVNYPDKEKIFQKIEQAEAGALMVDAVNLAKEAGNPKAVNMVMIGAASAYIAIEKELLKQSIEAMFKAKGTEVVSINLKAFELGLECHNKTEK
jgi:indolepyruvate ferredoxin oxidoreductase, beta subunit